MSQKVNQKEYLKKYFGGHNTKKLKKLDRLKSKFNYEIEEYVELTGEDAPQIVNIIDEGINSDVMQVSGAEKWKSIANSQSGIQKIGNSVSQIKQDKYQNINLGVNRTDIQKNTKNSVVDLSPPRKNVQSRNILNLRSNDLSPPRKGVNLKKVFKSKVTDITKEYNKSSIVPKNVATIEPVVHESTNKFSGNSENTLFKEIELEKTKKLYCQWGKGIRQVENEKEKSEVFSYESGKPLARYSNDKDLDSFLKEQDRHGDPMLNYINKNTRKTTATDVYKGFIPENRFNIKPGYRWDGVNRSNGYEKKYFDQQSKMKIYLNDAYTFGSEDL